MIHTRNSMARYGIRWYCQSPGSYWATDPVIGLHLKYDPQTRSWWLYRDGRAERADTESNNLRPAMNIVGESIRRQQHGTIQRQAGQGSGAARPGR